MALGRRKRQEGTDRLTLGLAAVAVATAGTVLAGEVIRLARRRAAEESAEHGVPPETAELSLGAATQAAQDSLTVAIEGYTAALEAGDDPVQPARRLRRLVRAHALLDLGHPQRLVAGRGTSAWADATCITSFPGS